MRSPGLIAQNCCRSTRISRKATGLVAGLYQRWRTVAHCTQPEPRHLLQLGSEDTQKSFDFKKAVPLFKISYKFLGVLWEHKRLKAVKGASAYGKSEITSAQP